MRPKNLILLTLVLGSLFLLSGTQINPYSLNPSNRLDSFPSPQNLWVDTLACIAYWDEPAGDSLPDNYRVTLGGFQPWDFTDCTYYIIPSFLEYGYSFYIDVWAMYGDTFSVPASDTFTSGFLPIPRNLEGESWENVIALTWEVPHRPDTTITGTYPYWVHANFPTAGTPSEYGVETDGTYIYSTQSNGNLFYRYETDGTFIGSFTINGVSNLRDLAYYDDNGLFYGGNGGNTCYVMDFTAEILVSTFTAPVEIQAIAYDEDLEGLWACSWSSDIMLFDLSGNLLSAIPNPTMNFTGLAYDNVSDGGPYLWGFTAHYGGADLVKIDIGAGGFMFNMSVYPRVGGSGPPGGLFTHNGVFVPGASTLGGMLQNDRIFGLEIFNWNGIAPPMVPPNLLGYTLYVNNDSLDYIPFIGEDTSTYYDTNTYPYHNYLSYEVSALYDMEPYGMPGDTGESYPEGPLILPYLSYQVLPFSEEWWSGSFEVNDWVHEENWEVIGQTGNPEPSARFTGSLGMDDYSSALTTTLIDGIGPGTPYIDGDILVTFDLKLESSTTSGDELLLISVLTEDDTTIVDLQSNAEGSFDWKTIDCYLTPHAFGKTFRVQFEATGDHSADITGWYLDNITIFRICPEPTNLHCLEITPDEFLITWEAPDYQPPTFSKDQRDLNGYNIYVDNELLDFTEDTFYLWHPAIAGELKVGVSALYEDCESYQADTIVSVTVGIHEYLKDELMIYPNPTKDYITIQGTNKFREIRQFNKLGELVYRQQVAGTKTTVNTSHLGAGIYVVQVVMESGDTISRKVIVYK
ncbi:MAG: T9SS type A sorting domain-containing protein [Bacteroidota bacterium]|nr:T9SS type A sorting domain-containing protein [Bacteroidota bacterium]